MRAPLRGGSQLARFLPSRLTDRSRSARPVRPQPATSIPAGGSKMHSFNVKKTKDLFIFLSFYLFIFLSFYLFNCLSLGRESRRYRDVPAEFGAPWMGDTKPERRWRLG